MGMQHAPDIDEIFMLNVEHDIGITPQHTGSQLRKRKFVRIPRRSAGGLFRDRAIGGAQRVDEAHCDIGTGFAAIEVDGRFDVSTRQFARPDRLLAHLPLA